MSTQSTKQRSPADVLVTVEDWCVTLMGLDENGAQLRHVVHDECPPATLTGYLRGERPTADPVGSIDPRGIGVGFAPHTSISTDGGCARAPLAVLLGLIEQINEPSRAPRMWQCASMSSDRPSIGAFEGVVAAIADRIEQYLKSFGSSLLVRGVHALLPVPNSLTLDAQERLISWGRQSRVDLELVWRPVAAALGAMRVAQADADQTASVREGKLLVVHLGLESFEITPLELRYRHCPGHGEVLVPARRLPNVDVLRGQGLRWAESAADRAVGGNASRAWNLLWATDWLKTAVTGKAIAGPGYDARHAHLAQEIGAPVPPIERGPQLTRLRWGLADGQAARWGYSSIDADRRACGGKAGLEAWIESARDALGDWGRGDTVSVIGTGSFASVFATEVSLARSVARRVLGDRLGTTWIEGETVQHGSLYREGVIEYATRKRAGIPPYLDVLPAIEVLVTRRGEPVWQDLLDSDDEFVPGGQIFRRRRDDLGLGVGKEEERLTLTVAQEGFTTVRETETSFPRPVQATTAVDMDVRMQPGQGYPRIEVLPRDPSAFSGARVELDWRRVADTQKTKQEAQDEIPRTNPPTNPRNASVQAWEAAAPLNTQNGREICLVDYLERRLPAITEGLQRDSEIAVQEPLRDIAEMFRRSSRDIGVETTNSHHTAVDSNGMLAPSSRRPDLLEALRGALDGYLSTGRNETTINLCLRCLAYSSSQTPNLMDLLASRVARSNLTGDTLNAIGCCLRDRDLAGLFVTRAFERLRKPSPRAKNDTMRALCRLLQYRDDALGGANDDGHPATPSELCELLTRACLRHIAPQVASGNLQYIYRHGSLAIVYLLRRRRYDDSYLPPDHPIAEETKTVFREVIAGLREGRMKKVGGFVDLMAVTQQMIDYIDRKGRGRLVAIT